MNLASFDLRRSGCVAFTPVGKELSGGNRIHVCYRSDPYTVITFLVEGIDGVLTPQLSGGG